MSETTEKPTRLLYLVPIFMGLLGGVLMYIAVRNQNQGMANDGMFWGVISTIVWAFLYVGVIFFGASYFPSLDTIPIFLV